MQSRYDRAWAKHWPLSIALGVGALSLSTVAAAQDQESTSSVGEIVVTAEKRSQSIQDVPVAVTAFTAETREETGIVTTQQQLNFTPGVTYEGSGGRVTIRGVGQASLGPFGLDPGVAVYQDGFYVANPEYLGSSTLAAARSEVLRGPQGTLYGRNSIGGALNAISQRPDDEWRSELRSTLTDWEGGAIEGRVSGPLNENVRFSVRAGADRQDEGYYTNLGPGGDEGGMRSGWNAEMQLEFDIGTRFNGWLRYYTQAGVTHSRNSTAITNPQPSLATVNNQGIPNVFYEIGPQYGTWDLREFDTNRQNKTSLDPFNMFIANLDWDSGAGFDIKYVGGYLDYTSVNTYDRDATSNTDFLYPRDTTYWYGFGILPANFDTNPATVPADPYDLSDPNNEVVYQPFHSDMLGYTKSEFTSWSHEVNFTSNGPGPLQWLFGLFYYHEDSSFDHRSTYDNNPFYTGVTLDSDFVKSFGQLETDSSAVFGQIDYDFSEQWHATLGLRYSHDVKKGREGLIYIGYIPAYDNIFAGVPIDFYISTCGAVACNPGVNPSYDTSLLANPADFALYYADVLANAAGPADDTLTPRNVEDSWNGITGTLGLEWTPSDDTLVYARYSTGYKSGGFNLGNVAGDPVVDEESVTSYELGWKQSVGRQFQFNSAVFLYKYEDLQLSNAEILNNLQVSSLVNVAEIENYGFELETIWTPIDNLRVMANYSYLHSEITETGGIFVDSSDPGALSPGAQPQGPLVGISQGQTLDGNAVPGTPENKFALNVSYTWNFTPGNFTLSSTYNYRDEYYSQLFNTPNWLVPSGETVDLRGMWNNAEGNFSVIASASNIFDEEVPISIFTGTPQQSNFQTLTLQPPRIVSLELQYRF